MSYLTFKEFLDFNTGVEMNESEFDTLSFYADNAITAYIGRTDIQPDSTIKRAAAAQIALSKQNGGIDYYSSLSAFERLSGEHLGDYSYSVSVSANQNQASYGIFSIVEKMLSGYRIRGVNVIL